MESLSSYGKKSDIGRREEDFSSRSLYQIQEKERYIMSPVMLVSKLEGVQVAHFYDDVDKAIADADIIMVSLGGYAEVYERSVPSEENDFEEGYTLVYCG